MKRAIDQRQGDLFAPATPAPFSKQLDAHAPEARSLLASMQADANIALANASLIDEIPWRDQPELLGRVRELNDVPASAVAAMMGARFQDPAIELLDRAIEATGKDAGFKVEAGLLARRIAAWAKAETVSRVHVAEALSYLLDPRANA